MTAVLGRPPRQNLPAAPGTLAGGTIAGAAASGHAEPPVRRLARFADPPGRRLARFVDRLAAAIVALAALALVAVAGGSVAGFHLLVVESGSMVPTMRVGDLVVSETVRPLSVHPGQIVTFRDVMRHDELVTHRVVRMVPDGPVVHFTTKGDANKVPEHWSIPKDGTIGKELAIVPYAGRVMADLGTTTARLVAVWLLALWLVVAGCRRIWRAAPPDASPTWVVPAPLPPPVIGWLVPPPTWVPAPPPGQPRAGGARQVPPGASP